MPLITSISVINFHKGNHTGLAGVMRMSEVLVAMISLFDTTNEYLPKVSSRFLKKI